MTVLVITTTTSCSSYTDRSPGPARPLSISIVARYDYAKYHHKQKREEEEGVRNGGNAANNWPPSDSPPPPINLPSQSTPQRHTRSQRR